MCFSRTTNDERTDGRKRKRLSSPDARKHILEYVLVLSERIGEVTTRAEDGGDLERSRVRYAFFLLLAKTPLNETHDTHTLFPLAGTMCDLIEHECEKAERDLFAACRQSLAHGALLATRYVLEEIDFSLFSDDGADGASPRLLVKASLARLLRLMERVSATALRSISAPDGANVGVAAADIAPDRKGGGSGQGAAAARAAARATSGVGGTTAGDDLPLSLGDDVVDDDDDDDDVLKSSELAPRAQMIVTACWLTMKEVSLVIGELARRVDVDGGSFSDAGDGLLDHAQLRDAGNRLLTTLLTLKHNGAIEKTLVGLTCLGEALLRSGDARLSRQPREWLASLFERTTRPEQDVRDLIRRSAGIPFGFMAVFLAEPRGVPRTLLHEALEKLLDLAVRGTRFFFLSRALFLAVVFRHSSKLVLLSSRRTKTAAVTKTRLPLLMISEDDRRLNRTNKHPGQDRAVVARKRGSHARKRARFSVFVSFFLVVGSDGSVSFEARKNQT